MVLSEKDIIKKCKKGDRNAQEALFRLYGPKMMGICLRYAGNTDQAKDLLHDGFIKVFTKISGFKEESSLYTWLSSVFINNAITWIRKQQQQKFVSYSAQTEDFSLEETEMFDEKEVDFTVEEALALVQQLPEKYRLIVNLYCVDGFSHAKIAELLGISEGTSKSQLSRARVKLMAMLQQKKRVYENV